MTSTEFDTRLGPDTRAERLARLDRLANVLDAQFRLPVVGVRFGWDSILGLIPGIGALATVIPSAVILTEGYRLGLRRSVLARMAGNSAADVLIGAVPVVGDVFDLYFKSHKRNMALMKDELRCETGASQ